jgi:hypothetical protein
MSVPNLPQSTAIGSPWQYLELRRKSCQRALAVPGRFPGRQRTDFVVNDTADGLWTSSLIFLPTNWRVRLGISTGPFIDQT